MIKLSNRPLQRSWIKQACIIISGLLTVPVLISGVSCPRSVLAVSAKYKNIIEKDPFDPKRGQDKTAIEGGAVSSEGGELEKRYSVYGIILAGNNKSAFIKPIKTDKRGKTPELRKITSGDLVDGWTVKDITDQGVLLVSGKDKVILKVFSSKKDRKASTPVGLATPRPVPFKPAVTPSDQERLKAALKRSKHPKRKPGSIFPSKENGPNSVTVNPFLKALQRQKEREKARLEAERP